MSRRKLSVVESVIVIVLVIVIFGVGLLVGLNYGYLGYRAHTLFSPSASSEITRTYNLIRDNFDGTIHEDQLKSQSIAGMIQSLNDKNSRFLTAEEYTRLKAEIKGTYEGIGIAFAAGRDKLKIVEVFPGSEATRHGIVAGDEIVSINGRTIGSFGSSQEIKQTIQGKAGTAVELSVVSDNREAKKYTLRRGTFVVPDLTYRKLNSDTGYLKIREFETGVTAEFASVSAKMNTDKIKNLVIDLRNNPGGNTETALSLLDNFIESGVFVREKFKSEENESIREAEGGATYTGLKIAVIINSQTASAAEIFAAAIQDNKRGKLAGEKTYGKGTMGNYFELSDGSAIHLTIGHWKRPNRKSNSNMGIIPDIKLSPEELGGEKAIEKAEMLFSNLP